MKSRQRKINHHIPRKGDGVYVDGHWVTEIHPNLPEETIWIKAERTRVNGVIIHVDYDDQEVTIRWIDHPHADPEESLVTYMDFATLYGQWSTTKECYVIQDSDV